MRRLNTGLVTVLLVLTFVPPLFSQFLAQEITRREGWEDFLRTAEIVRYEQVGEGVTRPWKLFLRKDGVETKGVWKSVASKPGDVPDHWRMEIAAYRLDKLLGLNMVPPVVEREFRGKKGDLSLWTDNKYSLLKIMEQKIAIPDDVQGRIDDMKYITRAWDSLIANNDRTQQNILITEDWRTILIDHTRAFLADAVHREKLIYGERGLKTTDDGRGGRRPFLFRRLPRRFVDQIRALDAAAVRASVGSYLTEAEIDALMARRKLLLAEIDAMIARDGEAVLY